MFPNVQPPVLPSGEGYNLIAKRCGVTSILLDFTNDVIRQGH